MEDKFILNNIYVFVVPYIKKKGSRKEDIFSFAFLILKLNVYRIITVYLFT